MDKLRYAKYYKNGKWMECVQNVTRFHVEIGNKCYPISQRVTYINGKKYYTVVTIQGIDYTFV